MTEPLNAQSIIPLARQDLACYAMLVYSGYELAAHNRVLIEHLERVERGELRRLIVCMPPRHGKSLTSTIVFPSWYLGRHPEREVISASYGQDLADGFGRKVRNILSDPLHQSIFPDCRLSADSSAQNRFATTRDGAYYACGRGAAITGRGAHLLVLDDMLKDAEEARSETIRQSLKDWFSSVAFTRLYAGAPIVMVTTRWHEDDLAGWLLSEHKDQRWTVLNMPAISESEGALWPERFPIQVLTEIRSAVGSSVWNALYQGNPVPEQGGIIKKHWWKFYVRAGDPKPEGCLVLPDRFDEMAQSWDLTFKETKASDYVCGGVWGRAGAMKYLLDICWERLDFVATKRAIVNMSARWPKAYAKWIEDKANGPAVIAELRTEISGLIPIEPLGSKEARLHSASPDVEAGNVVLPHPSICNWTRRFIDECASACCGGKHDDAADMLSQAIARMRGSGTYGCIEFYKREHAKTLAGHDIDQEIRISKDADKPDEGRPRCIMCKSLKVTSEGQMLRCRECWLLWPRNLPPKSMEAVQ